MPAVHLVRYGEGVNKNKTFADIYRWSASTVVEILKKREYLGHTVNFKTRKHFKDKKSHYVDESEWTIFENTHEAIIDQETFDNVQRMIFLISCGSLLYSQVTISSFSFIGPPSRHDGQGYAR